VHSAEHYAWLRLARTENIGPITFAALIARFGSATAALEAVPAMARDMVAIVGARNASALGRRLAWSVSRDLGEAGLAIVSGLARGIDAAAHEAALDSGTVAVVAGGIDIVYPPENQVLYDAIRERGLIVSEMRLGEAPQARHFPRRNRLISGLARGVVVVEAAERSGSLITAQYALEQGREIFAVPGSPLDPRAKGCNRLLREGATLTESAEDVLAVLRPILGADFQDLGREPDHVPPPNWESEADKVRTLVEEALGPAPVAVDELIRQLAAPPGAVLTVLLELELAGRCARHPGNRVPWS
jgi:DNA processing protein